MHKRSFSHLGFLNGQNILIKVSYLQNKNISIKEDCAGEYFTKRLYVDVAMNNSKKMQLFRSLVWFVSRLMTGRKCQILPSRRNLWRVIFACTVAINTSPVQITYKNPGENGKFICNPQDAMHCLSRDSNSRPSDYRACALSTEPSHHN